eukprot:COSAG01_NODE_736_length_13947_cov_174.337449_22_plen_95_part_00
MALLTPEIPRGGRASYGIGFAHTRDLSIDRSILHACWLRFTAESILAETSDWLASKFCLLSTNETDLRRYVWMHRLMWPDKSSSVSCLLAGWLI